MGEVSAGALTLPPLEAFDPRPAESALGLLGARLLFRYFVDTAAIETAEQAVGEALRAIDDPADVAFVLDTVDGELDKAKQEASRPHSSRLGRFIIQRVSHRGHVALLERARETLGPIAAGQMRMGLAYLDERERILQTSAIKAFEKDPQLGEKLAKLPPARMREVIQTLIYDPQFPTELAEILMLELRVFPALLGLSFAMTHPRALPPWLTLDLADRFRAGLHAGLRLVAAARGDVEVNEAILPSRERLDLQRIAARHEDELKRMSELPVTDSIAE